MLNRGCRYFNQAQDIWSPMIHGLSRCLYLVKQTGPQGTWVERLTMERRYERVNRRTPLALKKISAIASLPEVMIFSIRRELSNQKQAQKKIKNI